MQKKWVPITAAMAAGMLAGAVLLPRIPAGAKSAGTKSQAAPYLVAQAPGGPPPMPGGPGFPGGPGGPGFPGGPGGPMPFGGPQFGGPPQPPTPAMVVSGDYIYVLAGRNLYQFAAKDLKMLNKAQLPDDRPRPPRAGSGPDGQPGNPPPPPPAGGQQ